MTTWDPIRKEVGLFILNKTLEGLEHWRFPEICKTLDGLQLLQTLLHKQLVLTLFSSCSQQFFESEDKAHEVKFKMASENTRLNSLPKLSVTRNTECSGSAVLPHQPLPSVCFSPRCLIPFPKFPAVRVVEQSGWCPFFITDLWQKQEQHLLGGRKGWVFVLLF